MKDLQTIFEYIIKLINTSATILISVALVGFLFGILRYFRHSTNSGKRAESKKYMIYGLFSMFVIVSFWGLILLVGNVFGLNLRPNSGDYLNNISGNNNDEIELGPDLRPRNSVFGDNDISNPDVEEVNIFESADPSASDFFRNNSADTNESNNSTNLDDF